MTLIEKIRTTKFEDKARVLLVCHLLKRFEEGLDWANEHFEEMTPELCKRFHEKLEKPLDEAWAKLSIRDRLLFLQLEKEVQNARKRFHLQTKEKTQRRLS